MSQATARNQLRSGQEARRSVMSLWFVQRSVEPSPEATTDTSANDSHLTQLQRLEVIIDLLESLARSGLPTLINSFQKFGDFTKLHTVFHTDASTASFTRVGNWNLALVGSLLCPPLRGVYNNEEAFGSFMEAFTVCQARLRTRPRWFHQYQRLVSLVDVLMATLLTLVTMCGYPKPNTQCIGISVQSFMCAMKTMCKHSLVEPRTKVDVQHNMLAQAHTV